MHGAVEPAGEEVTSCVFEYGTEPGALSQSAPCAPAAPYTGSAPVTVSAHLTGLQPATTYHYRIAAGDTGGTLYSAEDSFATSGPPAILEAGVSSRTPSAVQLGLVIAPHGLDTHYKVEYGASPSYGSTTAAADLGSEEEVVYTQAEITDLSVNTTYHFRVIASNAEGTVESADETFTTDPITTISQESAFHVSSSSVTLSAAAGSYGAPLTYRFEYGATASYGSSTQSTPVGSSYATAIVSELLPVHLYHFRIAVESELGTVYGPDATFTTRPLTTPSQTLADGRGYEKVSPNSNGEGNVIQDEPEPLATEGGWTEHPFVVSSDGGAVAYMGDPSEHGGTGQEGGGAGNQYVARRAESGWVAQNVEPPSGEKKEHPEYQGFSPDLSVGFVEDNSLTPLAEGAPGGKFTAIYAKTFSTGSYYSLLRSTPPDRSATEFGPGAVVSAYAGSSANLGHGLFMANDALTPNAIDGGSEENNLYDTRGGTTTLVNVLPDGSTEPNAVFGGPGLREESQPVLAHDVAEDGSRIFWTDLNTHALYVRENDTAPQSPLEAGKCTVSADACTVLIAEEAQYWNATPDGSRVLYTEGGDLYESDVNTGETEDLVPHGSVNGVLAVSSDLSYVYFVAKAALAPGAEPATCVGGEGAEGSLCNLYVAHTGDSLRFIGKLDSRDNYAFPEYSGDWNGDLGHNDAETTPDGTHLMFTSKSRLTGYESNNSAQIFIYDFSTNEISCVSCNPDGEAVENAVSGTAVSAYLPSSHVNTMAPHLISDDGNRIFFDTLTPLVPQDTNKKTDVYEWERDGMGSCTQSSGCIYLLSDGTSAEGSFLIGASTSGDDVFFTTRGRLVPEDENENIDVYDARVAAFNPPTTPQCTGTGCQGVASLPPVFATPPSTTYNGVGNLEPAAPVSTKAKAKPLTRPQKLAKALKACRKKPKKRRKACERQARDKYSAKSKKGSASSERGNVKTASGRGK